MVKLNGYTQKKLTALEFPSSFLDEKAYFILQIIIDFGIDNFYQNKNEKQNLEERTRMPTSISREDL